MLSLTWVCLCGCCRAAVAPQALEFKPLRQTPQLSPDEKKGPGRPGRKSDAELKELYAVHGTYLVPVTEVSPCRLYELLRLMTVRLALMCSQGSCAADTAQRHCPVGTWSSSVAPCIKLCLQQRPLCNLACADSRADSIKWQVTGRFAVCMW